MRLPIGNMKDVPRVETVQQQNHDQIQNGRGLVLNRVTVIGSLVEAVKLIYACIIRVNIATYGYY